jgi:hypothetical protein
MGELLFGWASLWIVFPYQLAIWAEYTGVLHRVRPARSTGDDMRQMTALPCHSLVTFAASEHVTLEDGNTQSLQRFPFESDSARLADNP